MSSGPFKVSGGPNEPENIRAAAAPQAVALADDGLDSEQTMAAILADLAADRGLSFTPRDADDVDTWAAAISALRHVDRKTALRIFRLEVLPMLERVRADYLTEMAAAIVGDGKLYSYHFEGWLLKSTNPTVQLFEQIRVEVQKLQADQSKFQQHAEPPWYEQAVLDRLRTLAANSVYFAKPIARFCDAWQARQFKDANAIRFGSISPLAISLYEQSSRTLTYGVYDVNKRFGSGVSGIDGLRGVMDEDMRL